jgi:hypothetical protein
MLRGNLASSKRFLAGNSSWVSLSKCLIFNLPQVAHEVSYLRQVTNQVARESCRDFSTRGLSIFCSFVPNDCDDVHRTAFGCWRLPLGFARWAESGRCSTPACGRQREYEVKSGSCLSMRGLSRPGSAYGGFWVNPVSAKSGPSRMAAICNPYVRQASPRT